MFHSRNLLHKVGRGEGEGRGGGGVKGNLGKTSKSLKIL